MSCPSATSRCIFVEWTKSLLLSELRENEMRYVPLLEFEQSDRVRFLHTIVCDTLGQAALLRKVDSTTMGLQLLALALLVAFALESLVHGFIMAYYVPGLYLSAHHAHVCFHEILCM